MTISDERKLGNNNYDIRYLGDIEHEYIFRQQEKRLAQQAILKNSPDKETAKLHLEQLGLDSVI